tara:strand:- start:125492 stop:125881 length:390 start_codon:yes stop_codon:yes gene_type:complete
VVDSSTVSLFAGNNPMTQLLLFDAPVSNAAVSNPPVSTPAATTTITPVTTSESATAVTAEPSQRYAKRPSRGPVDDHQPGVHHMGDLARLVLMRYDMVAKRRAELAEKRRAELVEGRQADLAEGRRLAR